MKSLPAGPAASSTPQDHDLRWNGQRITEMNLLIRESEDRRRPCIWISAALLIVVAFSSVPADEIRVEKFFEDHCLHCHDSDDAKAGMRLDHLLTNGVNGREPEWDRILEALQRSEMPPRDEDPPNDNDRQAVIRWIDGQLREAAKSGPAHKEPLARRLTNFEYENTMRDLLGVDLKLIDALPKDPVAPYDFNNTAEYMRLGPEQIERYLECARRALASAIVDPGEPEVHRQKREWKPYDVARGMGLDEIGVWGNRRHSPATGFGLKSFPKTGEFRIRMQTSAILPPGVQSVPLRLIMGYNININGATQRVETVGTARLTNSPDEPRVIEFRGRIENHPAQPGRIVNDRRLPDSMTITPQNLYDDGTLNDGRRDLAMPRIVINWIEFEAPVSEVWPPEHHTRILFDSALRQSDPTAYVREVLTRFMSRAYRRPAFPEEVAKFEAIHALNAVELGGFEAAIRETLAMVLVSPQFLYHTVADTEEIHQYEVASRLSYFLWGSMPDDDLFQLAAEGKLSNELVLEHQVQRMLKDDRSTDFADNFVTQWLSLSRLRTIPINQELFPRFLYYVNAGERRGTEVPYRPTIRDYLKQETVSFVGELIRRDASIDQLVDSDFAMLNQPLAAHYGIEGVEGNGLRPVSLAPKHQLGGLLTHGSILIANGTGTAPHPIYRAVWLREAILGDHVPPPPADVPALSDSAGVSAEKALTIGELLRQHRTKESCNDCHSRLDPWGIPFEQFNAIGRYQPMVPKEGVRISGFNKSKHVDLVGYEAYLKTVNTESVSAAAVLPDGTPVDGMKSLKSYLLTECRDDIAENVLRRLLSYALGRRLSWRERYAVQDLMTHAKENGYKIRSMLTLICQSDLFAGRISEQQASRGNQ